jgi:hypothetical protein
VAESKFDPLGLLGTFERHRVTYIVVGGFARIVQGAEELTRGLDVVPRMRSEGLRRLGEALGELDARRADGKRFSFDEESLVREPVLELLTDKGELKLVAQPEGTGGYEDLRRAARREYLGKGVRAEVASPADLGRMLAALGRVQDAGKLFELRRMMELERGLGVGLSL